MTHHSRSLNAVTVATAAIIVSSAVATCDAGSRRAHTEQLGDTVLVSADGPAQWRTRQARIDLEIGSLDGDPQITFGRLEEMALLPSGGVVVHDNHFMRVSRFDSAGHFSGELGSQGEGPGQYDAVMGLSASSGGVVYVLTYDRRILQFDPRGEYDTEWRPRFRPAVGDPIVPLGDSLLVLKIVEEPGTLATPPVFGFVTLETDWTVVDSTGPVRSPWDDEVTRGQSSLASRPFLRWSPLGFSVAGVTGRLAFEIRHPEGSVVRVEREAEPVAFLSEEWEDWEQQNEFLRQRAGDRDRYPPTPRYKPPIRRVFLPPNGEIWIERSTRSVGPDPGHIEMVAGLRATPEWLEPLLLDVFTSDGTYLGAIEGPAGIDVRAVSDDAIWGYRNGSHGEQYIVRLRVAPTGRRAAR